MLYAKAKRNYLVMVKMLEKPRTMRYVYKTMKSKYKTACCRVAAMQALGIKIEKRDNPNDKTMPFYVLAQPLSDAIKIIEYQATDRKSTRAPTALKKPSGAPWFIITDNCINIYKREL
jgi:hypothetical protein